MAKSFYLKSGKNTQFLSVVYAQMKTNKTEYLKLKFKLLRRSFIITYTLQILEICLLDKF